MLRSLLGKPCSYILGSQSWSGSARFPVQRNSQTNRTFHALRTAERQRPTLSRPAVIPKLPAVNAVNRPFHSTPPMSIPPCLMLLKTSTAIQLAETVFRITLTFIPFVTLARIKGHKILKMIDAKISNGRTDLHGLRASMLRKTQGSRTIFRILLYTPAALVVLTILASLERTPLTGRWRLILLSPEEEDDIAAQLAGAGWYQAVGDILAQNGPLRLLPPTDWRVHWVQDTLRRLEHIIPVLQREKELIPDWMECGPDDVPQPPPADFPLRPRPRASEYFRRFAEAACSRSVHPAPHGIAGPPYSLIVVDQPTSENAFSYGFGPDGGGGIVVFSGFLDSILAKHPSRPSSSVGQAGRTGSSWWSNLFGGLFTAPPPPHPVPTEEQTSELAILLAHELSHLVLSHHIETLSSGSIMWPGIMSIVTDVVRTLVFPITMLFGPFINDALAGVGRASSGEFARLTEYCTSQSQEIEADVVSARLLAHAGFDPGTP